MTEARAPFPGPQDEHGLTVAILARDEAARLPKCLAAIPLRYAVLIVDSGSTDATRDIARDAGCAVIENPWPGFAAQRNFALDKGGIATGWTLFIDADEIFSPEFFELFERIAPAHNFDAAFVTSRLVFKGRMLKHAPGYPILHARLVRTKTVRFVPNYSGHGETVPKETRTTVIDIPYAHEFYDGEIDAWMRKHIGLARMEIEAAGTLPGQATGRARTSTRFANSIFRVPGRFFYHYLWRGGFRDGRAGLEYSLMYAWYEMTKYLMAQRKRP